MKVDILNYRLAEFCELSYEKHTITHNGMDVLIQAWGDKTVVAVRGTEMDWKEWLRNLRIWPTGAGKYYYHSGFWKGSKELYPLIKAYISKHDLPRKIILTGHSQGAGIALCLAARFAKLSSYHFKIQCCVGYGSPKTMSRTNHKEDLGFDYWHFQNGNDIVSMRLPLGLFYKHVKPAIKLQNAWANYPNWKDHAIREYVQKLYNAWRLNK